ncbi:MAG: hypothetical protein OEZ01_10325, partial [Candidatus Heimdallarchaeota archaeon]|nr:hypothetical protein [Candidatus Heimdallarchaeota archaeon]
MDRIISIIASRSGLGHVSRQLALAESILNLDPTLSINFICDERQYKTFEPSFMMFPRISFFQIPESPVMMFKWNEIDVEATKFSFQRCMEFETQIRDDTYWGRILHESSLIISDLESFQNPIIKKLDIPLINVSNFTWSDILKYLNLDDLSDYYKNLELLADFNIQLPFTTSCIGFNAQIKPMGLLSRKINEYNVEMIKEKHGDNLVYIAYSGDDLFNLSSYISGLNSKGFTPIIFSRFTHELQGLEFVELTDKITNTQDYLAASSVVLGKTGYSTVSEIYQSGVPFLYFYRTNNIEDITIKKQLSLDNRGELINSIQAEEMVEQTIQLSSKLNKPMA